jgi:outer membrane protein, heavy metal efflux system
MRNHREEQPAASREVLRVSIVADQFATRRRPARTSARGGAPGRTGKARHAAVCSLVIVCAGCVAYQAAPLDPQRSAERFAVRGLDEPQLREAVIRMLPRAADAWPPHTMDRAELLAVALVRNPQLAVAHAQVQAALAQEVSVAQSPNPDLTLESEYGAHGDPHPWLYGLGLNWLLRSPERRRLELQIARLETSGARLRLMDQAWAVRRSLAAALSDSQAAQRRLGLLDRLAQAQDRLLAVEQQRVKAGEDPPGELIGAQQARLEIEQQRSELHALADAAQIAIAKALGLPPQALDAMTFAWPEWGEPPPVEESQRRDAREQALLSRADLGIAIQEYSSAETKLQLAIARQYPQFELEPGYYWDHGIAKFPFDVTFTLPFNGNRGEIAEARAGRELAGQRMLAVQADIFGEIAAAERAEGIARASTQAAERQLQIARQLQQQADLSLRLGESSLEEQVGADIIAMRAELDVVQMRAQLQAARNRLEDALRAPLSGPELALAKSSAVAAPGTGS